MTRGRPCKRPHLKAAWPGSDTPIIRSLDDTCSGSKVRVDGVEDQRPRPTQGPVLRNLHVEFLLTQALYLAF